VGIQHSWQLQTKVDAENMDGQTAGVQHLHVEVLEDQSKEHGHEHVLANPQEDDEENRKNEDLPHLAYKTHFGAVHAAFGVDEPFHALLACRRHALFHVCDCACVCVCVCVRVSEMGILRCTWRWLSLRLQLHVRMLTLHFYVNSCSCMHVDASLLCKLMFMYACCRDCLCMQVIMQSL
jgi:hypothetical protein